VLGDPRFDALPGATARYGRLGGSVYEIEIPEHWNHRLVLYIHGQSGHYEPVLNVTVPLDRPELVAEGYAWAASSLSRGDFLYGTGADETAALRDFFVSQFGQPTHTYLIGGSAGGPSALIAASRYPDRFDGVLALCSGSGTRLGINYIGDVLAAGFYAAGVNQVEFDPKNAPAIVNDVVLPALKDPAAHQRFIDTWVRLSGGPRPSAAEGLQLQEEYLLRFGAKLAAYGTVDNTQVDYRALSADLADFNEHTVRVSSPNIYYDGETPDNFDGDIKVPVITLMVSGDALSPPRAAHEIQALVDGASKQLLLVQMTADSPHHCGFGLANYRRAFGSLVSWVEDGKRPSEDR
jgi:pimeloyl-ACP methyl ester carboxylesterase